MRPELSVYKVSQWVVLGRTKFIPPHKITDELINEARIVHVVNGTSRLHSANQVTHLSTGDTLIMKTDNFINNWLENEGDERTDVIVFQLNSDLLHYLYDNQLPDWFAEDKSQKSSSTVKLVRHELIDNYYTALKSYFDMPKFFTEEVIQSKVRELISLLVTTDLSNDTRKIFGNLFNATSYEFQETIAKNIFEDLNIEDLAFLTGMSLSSFKRKFKDIFGTSPNKYIVSKRLDRAQTLLRTSDLTISEVAFDCGFSDVGYFSKTFKKHYNISPSESKKMI